MAAKRKQWAADSMMQACNAVKNEEMGLREAACKYNVPVKTLRRQTTGVVSLSCRPGPPTVFITEEEARLAQYCVKMVDRVWSYLGRSNGHGIWHCRTNWPF